MSDILRTTRPIDVAAEAQALFDMPVEDDLTAKDQPRSTYEDTVGTAPAGRLINPRERRLYMPFAFMLEKDATMTHVQRGLGELGLIKADARFLDNLKKEEAAPYAAALLNYDDELDRRGGWYATSGNSESDTFKNAHPEKDGDWAKYYGRVLKHLREVFHKTSLFEAAKDREAADREGVRTWQFKQKMLKGAPKIEVHTDRKDELVVVRLDAKHQVHRVA